MVGKFLSPGLLLWLALQAAATVYHVDDSAALGGTGLSWNAPFQSLNDALDLAVNGDEIWIAEGVYLPDKGVGRISGDRMARFNIPAGVTVNGGYSGNPAAPTQRSIKVFPVVLTGDLAGNDPRGQLDWTEADLTQDDENSFQVVSLSTGSTSAISVLDGVTVRSGNANGSTVAEKRGAGIRIGGDGSARIEDCLIEHCRTVNGGALSVGTGTTVDVIDSRFSYHRATIGEGASINSNNSTLTMTGCELHFAEASSGGHISIDGGSATLEYCFLFSGYAGVGGGIQIKGGANFNIISSTIRANQATTGGGLRVANSTGSINSALIWGNRGGNNGTTASNNASFSFASSTVTSSYSLVQNTSLGGGSNLDGTNPANDPAFKHTYDSALQPGSPCINKGDPALPDSGRRDIGAFEATIFIVYVDASVIGGTGDGSSWANAFASLQDAIDAAPIFAEIWIAEGVYYPDEGVGLTNNNPALSFSLSGGIRLYGGFAGSETSRFQRDPRAHKTVLSGDLEQNDTNTDADGICVDANGLTGANSYHVVAQTSSGDSLWTSVIDGLYITAGLRQTGGTGTQAEVKGAGIYAPFGRLEIIDSVIVGNSARFGGGFHGKPHNVLILDSLFTLNLSSLRGGGVSFDQFPEGTGARIVNSAINGNQAISGGGLYLAAGGVSLINATLEGNQASLGSSIDAEAAAGRVTIANSILWSSTVNTDPTRELDASPGTTLVFRHSTLAAHTLDEAEGNVNTIDPILIDQTFGSSIANFTPFGDPSPSVISPLREMGDSRYFPGNNDSTNQPRRFGDDIDIGAFEYRSQIFRVDPLASGANDGSTWTDAITDLQVAIDTASVGDEIWLKSGVHRAPDVAGFLIDHPVEIYGGFVGTETTREQRFPVFNQTILSADIDANDTTSGGITLAVTDQVGTNASRVMKVEVPNVESYYSVPTTIDGVFISGAAGGVNGGGICHLSSVSELVLVDVNFAGNSATYGGGLYSGDNVTARRCVFSKCEADLFGGGMNCGNPGTIVTLEDCYFSDNIAGTEGGAIGTSSYGTLNVIDTAFIGNTAGTHGGAVNCPSEYVYFTDCTFTNNHAVSDGGAVRALYNPLALIFKDSTFTSNSSDQGGALYVGVDATVSGCTFTNNSATSTSSGGGAMFFPGSSTTTTLMLSDSVFSGNSAKNGAALHLRSNSEVRRSRFAGNSATESGSAIYGSFAPLLIESCEAGGNTSGSGGVIYFNYCTDSEIVNCTLQGNRILTGALAGSNSTFSVSNTIVWDNDATFNSDPTLESISFNLCTVTYSNSLIQHHNVPGTGNLNGTIPANAPLFTQAANPLSAPSETFDLNLQTGSPGIDVGSNALVAGPADRAYNMRIHNGTVDLGAFEFGAPPYTGNDFASLFPGLDPNADDNLNGASNFLDYATGNDPTISGAPAMPVLSENILTAYARALAEDFTISFERSPDLSSTSWIPLTEGPDFTLSTSTSGGVVTYTLTLNPVAKPAGTQFYRARYE